MNELHELYQRYLDMDDETRNDIALSTMNEIFNYMNQFFGEDEIIYYVVKMFSVFSCVDGMVNLAEYELFKYTTGATVTYDEFYEATKSGTHEESINELYAMLSGEDEDFRTNVFILAICIFTVNGTLTVKEQEFIQGFFM